MTTRNGKPKRLRLVKVAVQPIVVWDDGELQEQAIDPVVIAAKDWPEFPKQLAKELAALEKEANEGDLND